jgi:PAS domain S-box-containing protein
LRILVVDDHEIVRRGVRSLLSAQPNVQICGEAVDGRDAIFKAQQLHPDVVVMDISMPHLNGLDATRELRQMLPNLKILILSQHDLPEMINQAFSAGAHGYVVKSAISTELVAALERVQAGALSPSDVSLPAQINIDVKEILQRSNLFQQALRETAEHLRLAQQIARIGTFEFDPNTGVNRWTPELEALYGLAPGAFSGTCSAWSQLIHPDDRSVITCAFDQADDGGTFEREWRVVWPDGSVHWLLGRAHLFKDEHGRAQLWVGVNIDITERKLLEEHAEKLSRLLDLSFDAILVRDTEDRVRFWNRAAQELYGWSEQEATGRVTHTLLRTTFPEPLETIFATLRQHGRWQGELTHTSKDDHRVTVMSRWGLIRDWETGQHWVMETNTDITKRKDAEASRDAADSHRDDVKPIKRVASNSLV